MTTGSIVRLPGSRELSVDVSTALALAVFLAVMTPLVSAAQPGAPAVPAAGLALLACCGAGVAARRASPLAAYAVAVGAADAYLWLGYPGWPIYLGAFAGLAVLVAGVADPRVWVPAALVGGAGLVAGATAHQGAQPGSVLVLPAVWAAVAVLGAREARARRRRLDEEAGRRQAEERLRIARELHDVLSHSLASISLQAGVALHLLDRQPGQAGEALRTIRGLSTEALGQARAALTVVREGSPDDARVPGPTDRRELVASATASGLRVTWQDEVGGSVPPQVASTAYRVLQEALTNAMRHAGAGAQVYARLRPVDGWLELDVVDDGGGVPAPRSAPGGHGLRGMRERVQGIGGRLDVGPEPTGGFAVHARLPVSEGRR